MIMGINLYQLIKEYPCSPTLYSLVSFDDSQVNTLSNFSEHYVLYDNNSPEYVIKHSDHITELMTYGGDIMFRINSNTFLSLWGRGGEIEYNNLDLIHFLKNGRVRIIKVTVDGIEYSIGDTVTYSEGVCGYGSFTINNFFYNPKDDTVLARNVDNSICEYITTIKHQ
jgi:hypothetical protein